MTTNWRSDTLCSWSHLLAHPGPLHIYMYIGYDIMNCHVFTWAGRLLDELSWYQMNCNVAKWTVTWTIMLSHELSCYHKNHHVTHELSCYQMNCYVNTRAIMFSQELAHELSCYHMNHHVIPWAVMLSKVLSCYHINWHVIYYMKYHVINNVMLSCDSILAFENVPFPSTQSFLRSREEREKSVFASISARAWITTTME